MFYFCTKQFFMKVSDIVANTINKDMLKNITKHE